MLLGVSWLALKRWLDTKRGKVKAFLDTQYWFTVMAMPVQIADIKPIIANYYTFEKAYRNALSYLDFLDRMGDPKVAATDLAKKCSFQMKIKAIGTFAEKTYAQTH